MEKINNHFSDQHCQNLLAQDNELARMRKDGLQGRLLETESLRAKGQENDKGSQGQEQTPKS